MDGLEAQKLKQKIAILLDSISCIKDDITIVIVSNVKGITKGDDYEKHSVITDYFSESELEEIVLSFRNFGFYTEVFTDESEFIKYIVESKNSKITNKIKLVYNTSQKGIGAGRQSLMPAFCKLYNIPFIGSNAYTSSLCRHKFHFNSLLSRFHTHLPKSWLYKPQTKWLLNKNPPNGIKIVMKPIYEAASIGITNDSVFSYSTEMDDLIEECTRIFKQPVTVEEFIEGYEVEVPLIFMERFHGLGPVGISLQGSKLLGTKILSYEEVYNDDYFFYQFNELGIDLNKEILQCTKESAQILGMEDFGRIDFRITKEGKFYLTDITTCPHTVHHSSCNFIFNELGFTHSELLTTLASVTAKRYKIL